MSDVNKKQIGGDHYRTRRIQHWDYVIANNMPYLDAQAFKYIDRHARKNGKQDLQKAIHVIEKMIATYYDEPAVLAEAEDPLPIHPLPPLCPNHSLGNHQWSWVYRHGADGRMVEVKKCDLCQMEVDR